jgi:hypothetical protein
MLANPAGISVAKSETGQLHGEEPLYPGAQEQLADRLDAAWAMTQMDPEHTEPQVRVVELPTQ